MLTDRLFICQRTVEILSDELPKAVAKFGGVSEDCMNVAERILDQFVYWSPAGMLSIFQKVFTLSDLS